MTGYIIWFIGWLFTYGFTAKSKPTLKEQLNHTCATALIWPLLLGFELNNRKS